MKKNKIKKAISIELLISNTLRIGVWSSFWISIIGILLLVANNSVQSFEKLFITSQKFSFLNFLKGLLHFDINQITTLGVFILLLTPLLRLIFALFAYQQQKNKLYTAITLIVLAIIAVSVLIGTKH